MTAKKPVVQTPAAPAKKTAPVAASKPAVTKPAAPKVAPAKPAPAVAKPAAAKPVATKPAAAAKPATTQPAVAKAPVASKPVATTTATPAKPATVAAAPAPVVVAADEKTAKARKQAAKKSKPVRDSFTFPEADYALIGALKQRALAAGQEVKKSEVLRAGLAVLNAMSDADLLKVLAKVERIKTGRPGK